MKKPETLYGTWDYRNRSDQFPYDATPTYEIAGDWVSGRGTVEDWGCGTGWMRNFVHPGEGGVYVGLDGAWSRWCDKHVDLREYTSDSSCAVMRHVLEHNADWRTIAGNFARSWTDRAALVLFIPPQVEELDVGGPEWPVPDIAVSGPELFALLDSDDTVEFRVEELFYPPEDTIQWGWEGVILMERMS